MFLVIETKQTSSCLPRKDAQVHHGTNKTYKTQSKKNAKIIHKHGRLVASSNCEFFQDLNLPEQAASGDRGNHSAEQFFVFGVWLEK